MKNPSPHFSSRRVLRMIGTVSVFLLAMLITLMTHADQNISISTIGPDTVMVRIDQPIVTQRITEYPGIQFRPGDTITIEAGGCVQTGGIGDTWKRYVNPSGPDSDRYYHGLVWIPGVTPGPVRIAGWLGRTLTVPQGADLTGQLFLRLGYEDDGYGDNGYYSHDDGTEEQCQGNGGGPAFVILTIKHGTQPPEGGAESGLAHPFDLVWNQVDANTVPLNPRWASQTPAPGTLPGPGLCGLPWLSPCTTQSPSINRAALCGGSGSLGGHANWGVATYEGYMTWEGHSPPPTDDDYNINLTRSDQAGYTANNSDHLHTEFDSDETIDHFHTPWWESFHSAVDSGDSAARQMINGKYAIELGVIGLDCAHSCGSELHPVFAIAMHAQDNPADDVWAIFARNWGNEGFCGSQELAIDLSSVTFNLPWRSGATGVAVKSSQFLTNSNSVSGPAVAPVAGEGVAVTFTLPAPEAGARVNGELHLQWAGPVPEIARLALPPARAFLLATPVEIRKQLEPEERVTSLVSHMKPANLVQEYAALTPPKSPSFDNIALHVAVRPLARPRVSPPRRGRVPPPAPREATFVGRIPRVRALPNPKKSELDQKRLAILKRAYPHLFP